MDKFGGDTTAIIAGASGLVGRSLTEQLLNESAITKLHALVRHPLQIQNDKLNQIQDAELRITQWDDNNTAPDFGFICLGTTIKQAGSKSALAHVDYEMVCQVAQTMKLIGVKRIAVVSCYGANARSLSHYLRCKGRMEKTILSMNFDRVVFVRPGPLAGERIPPRKDEVIIGHLLRLVSPMMIGPLANFKPIEADNVARSMLFSLFQPHRTPADKYITLNTPQMNRLLQSYHFVSS